MPCVLIVFYVEPVIDMVRGQGALSGWFPSLFTKQIAEAIAACRYSKAD
jgi:hypothetical protein